MINKIFRRKKRLALILGCFVTITFICSIGLQDIGNDVDIEKMDLASIAQSDNYCGIDFNSIPRDSAFPNCIAKLEWMVRGWKTDSCYANYGVNGTFCSFYNYLSTIEHHCKSLDKKDVHETIVFQENLDHLFELMSDNPTNYQWIKSRISRLFTSWKAALNNLVSRNPELANRRKLNIVLYLGFLSKETGLKFGEKSSNGGPLGELVQWADLIASIYLLGHKISIATELKHFREVTMKPYLSGSACPTSSGESLDLIFTDIMGLRKIKIKLKNFFLANKCRIRLLDSFGTHAEFNNAKYFKEHWTELGRKKTNPWGGHGLELQQFLTMYPHTDDNTFLGFVVETFGKESTESERENLTLIYGKEKYMWNNTANVLKVINEFTEVHATVADAGPEFMREHKVVNHGLLSGKEFHSLLRKVKVFLGLGFPLEGPAPLEAIANGAIFINHKFDPPKSRLTYKFFEDKPTLRELGSQSPYMERFVGEPHVITVDVFNQEQLRNAFKKAMSYKVQAYLPIEFSFEGMLERVDVLLTKHNFCAMHPTYPPWMSSKIIIAKGGESCQDACQEHGLICERSFFRRLNVEHTVANFTECRRPVPNVAAPYAPGKCVLQKDTSLFSCASHASSDIYRICPCRTFKKGQIVLCDKYC